MPLTFVSKDKLVLRSLSTSPREMRSLSELAEITGLKPKELIERLSKLRKMYKIIEADGKYHRQYIKEIDGAKKPYEIREDLL